MKNSKNRTMATLIALFLISAMAISLVALPKANAQAPTKETYAFIGATPNPVGVGQQVLLHVGITEPLASVSWSWTGLTVTVTRPDGTTETLGPFATDATGGTGTVYTPSMVGNYTLQTHFPAQKVPGAIAGMYTTAIPANTTMLASDSVKLTLVVQQQPIPLNPGVPLPTEYWTRPINAQFREWYTISGSSWMDNEYNAAPDTPHILWTKPLTTGGLVGGSLGLVGSGATSVAMENGDAYEGKWSNRLILAGKLYYNTGAYDRPRLIHCVDLRTGEELWAQTFLNNLTISFGQLMYWQSYNYQGTFAYLWVTSGTTWQGFDAFTGDWMCNITNVPSGTRVEGPRGEEYLYTVNLAQGWMALWNQSALVAMSGSWGSAIQLQTNLNASATVNASTTVLTARAQRAWAWNITIPKGLSGSVRAINWTDGRVVGSNVNTTDVNIWAFSCPPIGTEAPGAAPTPAGSPGTLLYNRDWKAPASWLAGNQTLGWAVTDLTYNLGVVWAKETQQYYGFDLTTGAYLWVTDPEYYLSIYNVGGGGARVYKGNLYAAGMTGILYCYNITTGKTMWTYDAKDPYQAEILWSDNWPEFITFASGGKIYLFHQEHSANQPLPRGAPALCINATTGDVIWRVNGLFRITSWGGTPIMGDSVIAMYNTYDQQVYAIGQGPSATTVSIQNDVTTVGNNVMIKGTVTDVSPGTKETGLTLRFPNGVPAVSDDSMGDWMKYVYQQWPRPSNATGVEVTIDAVDPNGNFVHLGTATSDTSGLFHYAWKTPDVPGEYTVIATFAGSGAYYASYAETAMVISEAPPSPTPTPAAAPLPPFDLYILIATVVIVIAIAIVGIMIVRVLGKRP